MGALLARLPAYPGSMLLVTALNLALARHLPVDVGQVLLHKKMRVQVRDARVAFDFAWTGQRFAPHAPLVASFLYRVFVLPNERVVSEADLTEALEDTLFGLREQLGTEAYPKRASDYLGDWAAADKGWLRKFYKPGTDEAQFDLTPTPIPPEKLIWIMQCFLQPE